MSWIEKVKNNIIIITGDGKEYSVVWKNANKALSFNLAIFDFPEIGGSLIKRSKPKGNKYSIEFYFQGDDHLEQAAAFEISAKDSRTWIVKHPYYGDLNCHPTDLLFGNSELNLTKITGSILETIDDVYPKQVEDPVSQIIILQELQFEATLTLVSIVKPEPEQVQGLLEFVDETTNKFAKFIKLAEDLAKLKQLATEAVNKVNNAIADVTSAIRAVQNLILFPLILQASIVSKLTMLSDAFDDLKGTLGITPSDKDKVFFEALGANIMAGFARVSIEDPDYISRNQTLEVAAIVADIYNDYLTQLDLLQDPRADVEESYVPDYTITNNTEVIIENAISNLFTITFEGKQEHSIILDNDSNLILLSHRFYGSKEDSLIEKFMDENNIGLSEMFEIKKGRQLLYYV